MAVGTDNVNETISDTRRKIRIQNRVMFGANGRHTFI